MEVAALVEAVADLVEVVADLVEAVVDLEEEEMVLVEVVKGLEETKVEEVNHVKMEVLMSLLIKIEVMVNQKENQSMKLVFSMKNQKLFNTIKYINSLNLLIIDQKTKFKPKM